MHVSTKVESGDWLRKERGKNLIFLVIYFLVFIWRVVLNVVIDKDICQVIGLLHVLPIYVLTLSAATLFSTHFPHTFYISIKLNHIFLPTFISVELFHMHVMDSVIAARSKY